MIRNLLTVNSRCFTWLLIRTASYKEHDNETDNPEDSLERKLHYAKANVEQCLHRTINLYVKLIDDRAHTSRLQKKTSDIDSRTVWPSFDIAKVEILPQETSFSSRFLSFAEAITAAKKWQGAAKESAFCGFVYGGLVRSHAC